MQYQNGEGWRNNVKTELDGRNIKFHDPYHKLFVTNIPEDQDSRDEMGRWMASEQYDKVAERMKLVRGYDLRLCDICDWYFAVINPRVPSWGSAEEITTIIREKKPLFLVIDHPDGKKATPLWLLGMFPHKYIYSSLSSAIEMIKLIDDGKHIIDSDRWKLLREDVR